MTARGLLISTDHRAFANLDPKPPIKPVVYLYILPSDGVEYIAIDAPNDGFEPRAVHLEKSIGGGWYRVEVTGVTTESLTVWPLKSGEAIAVPVVL